LIFSEVVQIKIDYVIAIAIAIALLIIALLIIALLIIALLRHFILNFKNFYFKL
jgi:hypothetical protein